MGICGPRAWRHLPKIPLGQRGSERGRHLTSQHTLNTVPEPDGHRYAAPVGSYPDGASPFGIMDMAGNAEEWVHDWLNFQYYEKTEGAKDPQGP